MKLVSLGDLREAMRRVRSSSHLVPMTTGRLNVRPLFAIVTLGHLRQRDEIGGWPLGAGAMSWRTPSAGRRNLLIGGIDRLFGFPTSSLLRYGDQVRRAKGSGDDIEYFPAPDLPSRCALDPLTNLPPRPEPDGEGRIVWQEGTPWVNIAISLDSPRWWWSPDGPYPPANKVEFNPGNTINTQQGVECFFPLAGLTRGAAKSTLAIRRPQCDHFQGSPGEGVCGIAPSSEGCMAAKKKVVWPRVVMTDPGDPSVWGVAPDGFEALRQHIGVSSLGALRDDLSLIAGACKALREGQDFGGGTIVVDDGWFRSQLSPDAWEALRP